MYCIKCGKKVEDTDGFCSGCGNQLKESGANQAKTGIKNFMDGQSKMVCNIIIYLVLLLAFLFFSRANMFDFVFEEVTLTQFLEKIIYFLDMSKELVGLKVLCQTLFWIFQIGLFAYLGAVMFAFLSQNYKARICTVTGFVCNIVVVLAVLLGMFICAEELAELFYIGADGVFEVIKNCIKESFYLYAGLNVALLVCGLRFFDSEENIEAILSEKDRALLEIGKSSPQNTCYKPIEKETCILDGQLVAIGSLFGGTLFNIIVAFIAGNSEYMEWGIKKWCFTYIVALVLFGIVDFILNRLTRNS